ncbi:MAG: ATP-dependent DNA helicase RecG [Clostridiales bacterium]|nr:ATP-dependent DNA helicase RecG [Clostridiales bacterium]
MKLQFLKGIGPKRLKLLEQMGMVTAEDLLMHFPRRYEDRSRIQKLAELQDGQAGTFLASVVNVTEQRTRTGLYILKAAIRDESAIATATWFNQPYIKAKLTADTVFLMTGKVRRQFGRLEIMIQDLEPADDKAEGNPGRILAVYPASAGLQQKVFRQAIAQILDAGCPLKEFHSPSFLEEQALTGREEALETLHRPATWEALDKARERLAFDEFYFLHLSLAAMRRKDFQEQGVSHIPNATLTDAWIKGLPFSLTAAQKRVIGEIREDMAKPHAMARLVQGDVGAGKTAVAAWALLLAAENDFQGAMMVPTEILAKQHYETLSSWFRPLGLRLGLFTGSLGQKEARLLRESLAAGEIQVAVGTHALIQEKIVYQRLGLIIIDEQHRFGVRQRALLQEKGDHPDVLIMSATPIPRSLALTVYGDLDISKLDEIPPGRKPVETICILEKAREKMHQFLRKELALGNQVFVVCPLIEDSEVLDMQNAEEIYERLTLTLKPFPVGLLHGRMSGAEKEAIMGAFAAGTIQVLVSTTVVEVGVDVPAATVMVVENSERFGLAQLHQLRGRVGRGDRQAYCILVTNTEDSLALRRLKMMTETNDGFKLAEEDLLLRGPGELFGARQHGLPEFRLAKLPEDMRLMERAREAAIRLMDADPDLRQPEHGETGRMIRERITEMVKG